MSTKETIRKTMDGKIKKNRSFDYSTHPWLNFLHMFRNANPNTTNAKDHNKRMMSLASEQWKTLSVQEKAAYKNSSFTGVPTAAAVPKNDGKVASKVKVVGSSENVSDDIEKAPAKAKGKTKK